MYFTSNWLLQVETFGSDAYITEKDDDVDVRERLVLLDVY